MFDEPKYVMHSHLRLSEPRPVNSTSTNSGKLKIPITVRLKLIAFNLYILSPTIESNTLRRKVKLCA